MGDIFGPARQKKTFVLCFDGTGNKFSGTESDSNILKLYRMLDRGNPQVYTFYQPGIGTYINSHSMQTTSTIGKIKSAYSKAKDSAVGSSFAEHVMGGYKFLMRYYQCEDDLYFFGFSRGAYTARFLAEMLDHIGLLSAGNEELIRFAWKTYAKWASRKHDGSEKSQAEEAKLYEFMKGFRETFSRPVRRIRFLGLFDTVNSVPKFESAWMKRSKFPYTARSSAKVIRHAVAIDERRAKFRQDLVSGEVQQPRKESAAVASGVAEMAMHRYNTDIKAFELTETREIHNEQKLRARQRQLSTPDEEKDFDDNDDDTLGLKSNSDQPAQVYETSPEHHFGLPRALRTRKSDESFIRVIDPNIAHLCDDTPKSPSAVRRAYSDELHKGQDIEEVWFPGCHSDIGGGWGRNQEKNEKWTLSHAPLVWMVNEAARAGLEFDPIKMGNANCHPDSVDSSGYRQPCPESSKLFHTAFEESYSAGLMHDALTTKNGMQMSTAIFWNVVEYMPFQRMDLQPDGSWQAIRWPLPMGETRDIPAGAHIHHSAIKRMETDPSYRPGNLIVGGGGRGIRYAPAEYGIGEWRKHKHHDDKVRETYVRATTSFPGR